MGANALNLDVSFKTITCGECGGTYALSSNYVRKKREEGGHWNCPYCEIGWGFGDSKLGKLEQKLERERKRREWAEKSRKRARERAEHEARRAAGYKGAFTKAKKREERVAAGVCPCCNRSFENLRRHMADQHPEYPADPSENICGEPTASGDPCQRPAAPGQTCWQHG